METGFIPTVFSLFIYIIDKLVGLIYNGSRYYNPETCRFISHDVISILDETKLQINGLNLYVYCNNNPVMFVDPSGHSKESVLEAINVVIGVTAVTTLTACAIAGIAGASGAIDGAINTTTSV